MTTGLSTGRALMFMSALRLPPDRGPAYVGGGMAVSRQRLSTDSIGNFSLTLTNVVVGSAIRIEVASTGATVATRTAASSTEVFVVPAYAPGNANNDLRIKVRKASGTPNYIPFETQATLSATPQSIFVGQILDE